MLLKKSTKQFWLNLTHYTGLKLLGIKMSLLTWLHHLKIWGCLTLRLWVSVSLVGLMTSCAGILNRPVITVQTTKIYHPPEQTKPTKQNIDGLVITPQFAWSLSTLCEESKGYTEDTSDGLVNEVEGNPDYCAYVLMAFPKGDWSKFKSWLVDFEAYAKRLANDLKYYDRITREIEDHKK